MSKHTNHLDPVIISGEAHKELATYMRKWSAWPDLTLTFADPEHPFSDAAATNWLTHTVIANPEVLVLNPNRVITTVTPFRLKQEAVLTGALLHEAAHTRFTTWRPHTPEEEAAFKHSDGTDVAERTMMFARLMEEPRIEGCMARSNVEPSLNWTMQAMALHMLPLTDLSDDPDQQMMDIISSWALRAGRRIAMQDQNHPQWVIAFGVFLHNALIEHFSSPDNNPDGESAGKLSNDVYSGLKSMLRWTGTKGPFMVDTARQVLELLFPNTDQPPAPSMVMMAGCGEAGEGQDEAESGGSGDEQGEGGPSEGKGDDEGSDGESKDGETGSEKAQGLAAMEVTADQESEADTKADSKATSGLIGGDGTGSALPRGYRPPSADERDVQRNAERFLRNLIDPSENSTVSLTDAPATLVDGAALSAWKAGGQHRDPKFFRRTQRNVQPSPPVKIAVLVDVSSSMSVLQEPSALLSWALASAAVDLRNFAGRGQQIESTLIHWGDGARVIQANGAMLPGIYEAACDEGTTNMHGALELVEEQIAEFFTASDRPTNRLLVQFTDWELSNTTIDRAVEMCGIALDSGVNMLTVLPRDSGQSWYSALPALKTRVANSKGKHHTMIYNRMVPEQVWDEATNLLK